MKRILLLAISLITLTNCSATREIKINHQDIESIKGKSISVHTASSPVFMDKTPVKLITSGWLMMTSGSKIVKNNNIEDPARIVGKKLSDILRKNYKVKIKTNSKDEIDSYNVKKISNSYKGIADYVLSSRTLGYGLSYIRFDISNYVTTYSAQVKLIDVANEKVVAQGSCTYTPSNKHSRKGLLDKNAAILKDDLSKGAVACANLFKGTVFDIK